jgi:hypothetical protein
MVKSRSQHHDAPASTRLPKGPQRNESVLLALQRTAGNRAIAGLLAQGRSPLNIQRLAGDAPERPEGGVNSAAASAVAVLPDLDDGGQVPAGPVAEGRELADESREDVADPALAGSPALQEWLSKDLGAQPGLENDVRELASANQEASGQTESKPAEGATPKPGLLSRMGGGLKSFGRSIGGFFKGLVSSRSTKGVATGAQGLAQGGSAMVSNAAQTVSNPASLAAASLIGGSGASQKASDLGSQLSDTAKGGAGELTHLAGLVAGMFFSAIKAAVDGRALFRSISILRGLKRAKAEALATGADPALVEAVDYAVRQKYQKAIKRAIGMAAALASLGIGLAVLLANPVGAGLAALIIGGIGVSMMVYKIGRYAFKKKRGEKRKLMAGRLFAALKNGDSFAVAAVRELHLDPEAIRQHPKGEAEIFRKLRSA